MLEMISAAAVLGIGGALHCIGMCGPLVLVVGAQKKLDLALYHLFRLFGYGMMGLILGAISLQIQTWVGREIAAWLTFVFAGLILFSIFFPIHEIKALNPVTNLLRSVQAKVMKFPVRYRAMGMGFVTAFLPCGLLYMAFALALATNSALLGGMSMLIFGIASSPGLILGHAIVQKILTRLSPIGKRRLQQVFSLVAVFFMVKMGLHNLSILEAQKSGEDSTTMEASCH